MSPAKITSNPEPKGPVPRLMDDPDFAAAAERVRVLCERGRLQREKVAELKATSADADPADATANALLDDPAGAIDLTSPRQPAELAKAEAELDTILRAIDKAEAIKADAQQDAAHRLVDDDVKSHHHKLARRVALAFVELDAALQDCRRYRSDLTASGLVIGHLPSPIRPAWLNINSNQLHNHARAFLRDMVEAGYLSADEATAHIRNPQSAGNIRAAAR